MQFGVGMLVALRVLLQILPNESIRVACVLQIPRSEYSSERMCVEGVACGCYQLAYYGCYKEAIQYKTIYVVRVLVKVLLRAAAARCSY